MCNVNTTSMYNTYLYYIILMQFTLSFNINLVAALKKKTKITHSSSIVKDIRDSFKFKQKSNRYNKLSVF